MVRPSAASYDQRLQESLIESWDQHRRYYHDVDTDDQTYLQYREAKLQLAINPDRTKSTKQAQTPQNSNPNSIVDGDPKFDQDTRSYDLPRNQSSSSQLLNEWKRTSAGIETL